MIIGMYNDNMNISKVETFIKSLLGESVSKNTFAGTLPDVTPSSWRDMCLIDCGDIADNNAYGVGTVLIWLYAKPMSNGSKNVSLMSKMEKSLNVVLDSQDSDIYKLNRMNTYQDYDSDRKWHCNIVELNIKIY